MKFQKVLSGLNATPSQIKRKLKNVRPAGYNMNLNELLNYGSYKLKPIIELLVKYPEGTELFIATTDCDIIEEITRIIKVIGKTLEAVGFQTNIGHVSFNMQKHWKKVYPDGRVHVDVTLLLAILELNSLLENIRAELDAFHRSTKSRSPLQTESGLTSATNTESTFSYNPNKSILSPETKSSFALLPTEIVLLPSVENVTLTTSESQMLGGVTGEDHIPPRKVKSNMSFDVAKISGVADVDEARNILFKCIHDLKAVSDYLGILRKDAFTQNRRTSHEVKGDQESSKELFAFSTHQQVKEQPPSPPLPLPSQELASTVSEIIQEEGISQQSLKPPNENLQLCYCPECCVTQGREPGDLGESKNDHVIICIKSCSDDEEEVRIVIRRCPECSSELHQKPLTPPEKKIIPQHSSSQKAQCAPQEPNYSEEEPSTVLVGTPVEGLKDVPNHEPETCGEEIDGAESRLLYNKNSKENNVGHRVEEDVPEEKWESSIEPAQVWNLADDSRIKYFETKNLYLKTKTGEELVISLTVTPKDLDDRGGTPSITISGIFNDSDDSKSKSEAKSTKSQEKIFSYYIPDKYIPLGRTKICSSLDFDVSIQDSKIRDRDIKNNKIVVQLQHFGTDNLLRACRPAKCCRKSVLNEKMRKRLPYAPSLRSLPLDDDDISVINESLQMRLQKVKNSTNLSRDLHKNKKDLVNPVNNVLYFFVKGRLFEKRFSETCQTLLTKRKLSYYIHLVSDVGPDNNCSWEDFCFSVEKWKNPAPYRQLEVKPISSPTRKIKKNFDEKAMGTMPLEKEGIVRRSAEMQKKLSEGNNLNPKKKVKAAPPSKSSASQGSRNSLGVDKDEPVSDKQRKEVKIPEFILGKRTSSDGNEASSVGSGVFPLSESHKGIVKLKPNDVTQNCSSRFRDKNFFFSSVFNGTKRARRRKREVYLPRSRSENSLSALALWGKNQEAASVLEPKRIRKIATKTANNTQKVEGKRLLILAEEGASKLLPESDSAEIVLGCFSKVFHETVITETKMEDLGNNETKITNESWRRIQPKINNKIQELYMKKNCCGDKFGLKLSCPLNSQPSQCMVVPDISMVDALALQTSNILGDSNTGQISSSFKKICNQYPSNSCAKTDNLTVKFKTNEAIKSSGFESNRNSPRRTLLKLKGTLKKYTDVKGEVAGKSRKDPPISIEYFVYHQVNTSSKKSDKKLSIMQKILSRTKGLFSSSAKDKHKKCKNRNAINNLAETDREYCHNCGCSIAKCAAMASAPQQLIHSCPEDIKLHTEANKASCKKHNAKLTTSTFGNISKLASSSVLSIKARFKRPNSSSLKESERKLGECKWVDEDITGEASGKNVNVVPDLYVDENIMVTKWDEKNKEIGTMKGAPIQNCPCEKCEIFAENGTCCCSLCLDKNFQAKPENQNVGGTTYEQMVNAQIIESEPDKSDVAKILQSCSEQHEEKKSTNILSEAVGCITENTESIDKSIAEKGNSNNKGTSP